MNSALLNCQGVTMRFGGVTALDDVDFEAAEGDITGVIGPNGAGKTTLLNVITGMITATTGSVHYATKDFTKLPAHKRSKHGVVRTFQNLEIFNNMNVLENVMTGRHQRVRYSVPDCLIKSPRYRKSERDCRLHAMHWLEFVDLADKAHTPAGDLPFGSQRHVEIARALASEPGLILLDEPAAGLNMKETRTLGRIIKRINTELNITVVMVEHDMDLVMSICDTIFVLNYGRRLACGTPAEVRSNPDVIRAYLGEDED